MVDFPVDTNVVKILIRTGWLDGLPGWKNEDNKIHLNDKWLSAVSGKVYKALDEFVLEDMEDMMDAHDAIKAHYQFITLGKLFCTKTTPRCGICPISSMCKTGRENNAPFHPRIDTIGDTEYRSPTSSGPMSTSTRDLWAHPISWKVVSPLASAATKRCLEGYTGDVMIMVCAKGQSGTYSACEYVQSDTGHFKGVVLMPWHAATQRRFPLAGSFFFDGGCFVDHASMVRPIGLSPDIGKVLMASEARRVHVTYDVTSYTQKKSYNDIVKMFEIDALVSRVFNCSTKVVSKAQVDDKGMFFVQ